jgi:hypothetical protein
MELEPDGGGNMMRRNMGAKALLFFSVFAFLEYCKPYLCWEPSEQYK